MMYRLIIRALSELLWIKLCASFPVACSFVNSASWILKDELNDDFLFCVLLLWRVAHTQTRNIALCISYIMIFIFSRDSFNKHLWNFSLLPRKYRVVVGDVPWKYEGVLNFYDVLAQLLSRKIWKGIDFERPFTIAGFPHVTSAICWRHAKLQLEPLKFRKPRRPSQANPDLVNGWKIKSSKQASDKDTKQQSRICCQWRFHHRLECYLVLSLLIIWLRSRCVVCVLAVCDYISSSREGVFSSCSRIYIFHY